MGKTPIPLDHTQDNKQGNLHEALRRSFTTAFFPKKGGFDLPTRRQRPLVRGNQIAKKIKSSLRAKGIEAPQDVLKSIQGKLSTATALVSDTYNATLDWKNNSEFSRWLTDHFSNQQATIASKAMDAEYLRTHIGGAWHRLYDHGHTLAGSWKAVSESLPDVSALISSEFGPTNIGRI